MRSYRQQCAVAKALDVVGERWTLLIVRELLIRGGCRYTDLRHGLPGIATNLLAERLRELEQAGIVRRYDAPPPIASTLFELTPRGADLAPVLDHLARWGGPLVDDAGGEAFRSHWLSVPIESRLADREPERPPATIELRTGAEPLVVETVDGAVRTRLGSAEDPDAALDGPPQLVLAVLLGEVSLADARARGLRYDGSPAVLRRVRPRAAD